MQVEITNNKIDEVLRLVDEAKARVLEQWGLLAEGYAKLECPVDTGRLRNSISHGQADENTMAVGTNVEYAAYVELGTSRMAPRPYLAPAIEEHIDEYEAILRAEMQDA